MDRKCGNDPRREVSYRDDVTVQAASRRLSIRSPKQEGEIVENGETTHHTADAHTQLPNRTLVS